MKYKTKISVLSEGALAVLLKRLFPNTNQSSRLWMRLGLFFLITGLPLMLITIIDGSFSGTQVSKPFLSDGIALSRLFLVIPFLILAEWLLVGTFVDFLKNTERIIAESSRENMNKIYGRMDRLNRSSIPELIMFIIVYILSWYYAGDIISESSSWYWQPEDLGSDNFALTTAGYWFLFVSIPLYQFLVVRWVWRWLVWAAYLVQLTRLRWKLHAMHGDKFAGLEYLNFMPFSFSVCAIAVGINFSSLIYADMQATAASLGSYKIPILLMVLITTGLCYLPLVILVPKLYKLREEAIYHFGLLIHYHHDSFENHWYNKSEAEAGKILGSTEPSSMCDINGSYEAIQNMRLLPLSYKLYTYSVLLMLLPFLPLITLSYSFDELTNILMQSLLN